MFVWRGPLLYASHAGWIVLQDREDRGTDGSLSQEESLRKFCPACISFGY